MTPEYRKQYYQKNKDKAKNYYQKNKQKAKDYYKNNKEKILEYQKKYNNENSEMRKEYWKKYYIFFKKDYAKYNQIHYRINKKKILYNRRIYLMKNDNKSFDREKKTITISFN